MRRRIWLLPGVCWLDVEVDEEPWAVLRRHARWTAWVALAQSVALVVLDATLGWPLSAGWVAALVVGGAALVATPLGAGLFLLARRAVR